MHPAHPYTKQESRRAVNQSNNNIRAQLYQHGNRLSAEANRLLNNGDTTVIALSEMTGRVSEYMAIRRHLSPTVGTDRLTTGMSGLVHRLKKAIEERTRETNDESEAESE